MYLELDEGYPGHRKTLRLCALLKCDTADAYPPRLWAWATRSAADGDLTGMDPAELEMALRWRGKACVLFDALVDSGFIDRDQDGRTSIHNWHERTGAAIDRMAQRAYNIKERRAHVAGRCLAHCAICAGTVTRQSADGINQVKTSQVKTSQDQSSETERPSASIPSISRPVRRLATMGAATIHFCRCFDRYTNQHGKQRAAQVWQEIAETWPGGETALADAIAAAFDAGMLKRHPYDGEIRFRPTFERVLAERMWEDAPSKAAVGMEYNKI